jgi:beta-glucosidase/6-phospho-beta-glucosidase/beta-galactosidase
VNLELDLDFASRFTPDKFFFGVANAPYLSEGGYNYPDGIKNSFAVLELSDRIERSRESTRFWTDYERHIELAASLGLNAFRIGVDWARVQPSTSVEKTDPPPWDHEAVDRYARIVETIIRNGMEPIVTPHHFTHPAWAGLDFWMHDEGPDLLVEYELRVVEEMNQKLVERVGRAIPSIIVYNEVNLVPFIYHWGDNFPVEQKGREAILLGYDNMLSRYVPIYDRLHDLYERHGWGELEVGFGVASLFAYELDKLMYDLVRLRQLGVQRGDADEDLARRKDAWMARLAPLARSKLTDRQFATWEGMVGAVGWDALASTFTKTLDALYASPRERKLDYVSCNIYEPFSPIKGADRPGGAIEWWEYAADTEIYGTYTRAYNDGNPDLPVYMGENGLMCRQPIGAKAEPRPDGWNRERYFKSYFMEMIKCMKEGVPIQGYLFWSILDDFEWDAGYPPRCGLYNYDYETHEISDTDAVGDPAGEIYAYLIRALRSGDKEIIAAAFTKRFGEGPEV